MAYSYKYSVLSSVYIGGALRGGICAVPSSAERQNSTLPILKSPGSTAFHQPSIEIGSTSQSGHVLTVHSTYCRVALTHHTEPSY